MSTAAPADWSPRLGYFWGPICLSAVTLALAGVGSEIAGWEPWMAVVGGAALTVSLGAVMRATGQEQLTMIYGALCTCSASVWLAWALGAGIWNSDVLLLWLMGTVVLALPAKLFVRPPEDVRLGQARAQHEAVRLAALEAARPVEDPEVTKQKRLIAEWQDRVFRICDKIILGYIDLEVWAGAAGYTITWELPPGGVTRKKIEEKAEALATDADLPDACGVEVVSVGSRRRFQMQVSLVDTMALERSYFDQFPGLPRISINDPIPFGWHRDNSLAQADMRSDTWVLVGQKGSGKTNELNVVQAGLARCDDVLTFVIDTAKVGQAGRGWVTPWVEGRAARPVVDWIAATPEEALLMTEFCLQVLDARVAGYQQLKASRNADKLPIGPQTPKIVIIMDESAEVTGVDSKMTRVSNNLQKINRVGRENGVDVMPCGLRATSDVIPVTFKKQSRVRIGMKVVDEDEVQQLFGWRNRLDPNDIIHEGCGFWREGTGAIRPFRGWRMDPADIDSIAVYCAQYKPDLDLVSLNVELRRAYEGRWLRTLPLMFQGVSMPAPYERVSAPVAGHVSALGGQQVATAGGHQGGHQSGHVATPRADTSADPDEAVRRVLDGGQDLTQGLLSQFTEALGRFQAAGSVPVPPSPEGAAERSSEIDQGLDELWALPARDPRLEPDPQDPEPAPPEGARQRMVEILDEAAGVPLSGVEIIKRLRDEGYQNPEKTIYGWFVRPPVVKVDTRGFVHERHAPQ